MNRVILMGNLTRNPELKDTRSNTAVCEFGLAINRKWRNRDGEQQQETTFVDVTAFGRTGETLAEYLVKGSPILIEGRLKFDQWQAQDGSKRSKLSVVAESFTFVGGRSNNSGGGNGNGGGGQRHPQDDPGPASGDSIPF